MYMEYLKKKNSFRSFQFQNCGKSFYHHVKLKKSLLHNIRYHCSNLFYFKQTVEKGSGFGLKDKFILL